MDNTKTHHLIIKPNSAVTACGMEIVAYYPISNTAMLGEAGKEPINVNVGKIYNCAECKKKMKETFEADARTKNV